MTRPGGYFDGSDVVPIPSRAQRLRELRLSAFVEAGPLMSWLLRRLGLLGIVMPWRRVYVLPGAMDVPGLVVHECVHLDQIDRLGPVKFSVLYIFWLIKYGYRANPLEVEAYRISDAWEGVGGRDD